MSSFEHIDVQRQEELAIVRLRDEELISRDRSVIVARELLSLGRDDCPGCLIITFEQVHRFSSEFINVLIRLRGILELAGSRLMLCEMRPHIRESFAIVQLGFEIFPALVDALDAVVRPASGSTADFPTQ